jgi:hypothetical protein
MKMTTTIKQKLRTNTNVPTLTELGLHVYLLRHARADGTIQHSVRTIAQATGTPSSSVHLAQRGLINKGYVEEITPSKKHGLGGDDTAPVLRPRPLEIPAGQLFPFNSGQKQVTQFTESKLSSAPETTTPVGQEKAVQTGQILHITDNRMSQSSVKTEDVGTVVCDSTPITAATSGSVHMEAPTLKRRIIMDRPFVWTGTAWIPEEEVLCSQSL